MRAIGLHHSGRAGQGVSRANQGGRADQGVGMPFKAAVMACSCGQCQTCTRGNSRAVSGDLVCLSIEIVHALVAPLSGSFAQA